MRALSTAATGMDAQQTRLDVTANNIANVSTPGFKKNRAEFAEVMVSVEQAAGAPTSATTAAPVGIEIGMGVRTLGTSRIHSQGDMKQTGNPLDVAIEGDGFYQVKLPSGETAYTRDGEMKLDREGHLVTREGFAIGDINVPPDAATVQIAADGQVTALVPGEVTPVDCGKIELATFANPAGLTALGHNLLKETVASGQPTVGAPGEHGTGSLAQGMVEMSNVKVVEEMVDLIAGQRAYEINARVIKAADEMLAQASQLR
ncbi:MAG: flagellar basal-body rod protein FlgG [Myxococcota bacterium]